MEVFFSCINIHVLKQEKSEMDVFGRTKKTLVLKEKFLENVNILRKYFEKVEFSTDTLVIIS